MTGAGAALSSRLALWWWGAGMLARHRRPDVALTFRGGLGDELLCTAPLVEWLERGADRIWICTRRPDIFQGFAARAHLLPDDARCDGLARRVGRPMRYLGYSAYDAEHDRDSPPTRHIIAEMCVRAGLQGRVQLRPHWRITAAEAAEAERWRGWIAINSSTLNAHVPMQNKQWPPEHFQAVVDRFTPETKFVQIGTPEDPPLRGAFDLRGQTTVRQTAALLYHARGFVGLVGFLMHLARAVECPAVIVYGGRETPQLTGYSCNLHLTRTPECSPCWQRSRCEHQRVCMSDITPGEVAEALQLLLGRPRGPLAADTAVI